MKTEKENSRPLCFLPSKKRDALAAKKAFTPLEKASDFSAGYKSVVESGGIKLPSSFVGERNSLTGFTLAEILTVIVIIAILVGILMPALSQVKKLAKETKQKAQIGSIEMALELYKGLGGVEDFGEYPPSHGCNFSSGQCDTDPNKYSYGYCGAQTLTEALLGQDLLGFHPDSIYRADGKDKNEIDLYPPDPNRRNLDTRKGPYLARENIGVFEANDIYDPTWLGSKIEPDRYIICDVFGIKDSTIKGKKYKVGTPVLYFRANPSAANSELIPDSTLIGHHAWNIYNCVDNYYLINLGK